MRLLLWITLTLLTAMPTFTSTAAATSHTVAGLGDRAYAYTKELIAFGPRPSGSKSLKQVQNRVVQRLESIGLAVKRDTFSAKTPVGTIAMENLIGIQDGETNDILMLACHLESKRFDKVAFVGANDSASACALILEIAAHLKGKKPRQTIWYTFFDGEEAMVHWSAADSLYGSRHLAESLQQSGLHKNIKALVLLDMIGDVDLGVALELNSDTRLQSRVEAIAKRRGWGQHFFGYSVTIEDDHLPFARLGIPVLDLIDFRYPHFHNAKDTIDKISPKSLQIIGETVVELLDGLDKEPLK